MLGAKYGKDVCVFVLVLVGVVLTRENDSRLCSSDDRAEKFLCDFNKECTHMRQISSTADWAFETNMTDDGQLQKVLMKSSAFLSSKRREARKLNIGHLSYSEKRQFKLLLQSVTSRNQSITNEIIKLSTRIQKTYGSAKVCLSNGTCLLEGEAGITAFFAHCRDPQLLAEAWRGWRDRTGRLLRADWLRAMQLRNIGAREHNFPDMGTAERYFDFEIHNLKNLTQRLFDEISPLYRQLHGYVRYKLRKKFPSLIRPLDLLPAHLLGDPWGQQWQNLYPLVIPYPDAKKLEVTKEMRRQRWSIQKMVRTADNLFRSLGFEKMTPKFWKYSEFVKPKHRRFDCHASAFDFSTGDDFRIKMCANVDSKDLKTIHHEMGHIVYYMSYRHQPPMFQAGANTAFHESVGDTVALIVETQSYLNKTGLFKDEGFTKEETDKIDINTQMRKALEKVAFLPFALLMDKWRWGAYDGSVQPPDWNAAWWALRRNIQGVAPPVSRSAADFDPGAKYHVAYDLSYIRYFVSFILQFQFYEAMCKEKGFPDNEPLHRCDFSESVAAGKLLRNMLDLGASKHWFHAMRTMTGQRNVRTNAILRYFRPLQKWLTEYNCEHEVPIGWNGKDERLC